MSDNASAPVLTVQDASRNLRRLVTGISTSAKPVFDDYVVEVVIRDVAREMLPTDATSERCLRVEQMLESVLRSGKISEEFRPVLNDEFPSTGPFVGCTPCMYPCKVRPFVVSHVGQIIDTVGPYMATTRFEMIEALARSTTATNVFGYEEPELEALLDCASAIAAGPSGTQAAILSGRLRVTSPPQGSIQTKQRVCDLAYDDNLQSGNLAGPPVPDVFGPGAPDPAALVLQLGQERMSPTSGVRSDDELSSEEGESQSTSSKAGTPGVDTPHQRPRALEEDDRNRAWGQRDNHRIAISSPRRSKRANPLTGLIIFLGGMISGGIVAYLFFGG